MKVKDKVYRYEIKFDFKSNTVVQKQEEYTVIGVNQDYLCIDDRRFTAIKHKKSYRGDTDTLFNEVGICDWTDRSYLDYLFGYLYTSTTSKKIAYKRIKKALEKHIYNKHGRYCNAISFLEKIEL